jgi:hypothetical protein
MAQADIQKQARMLASDMQVSGFNASGRLRQKSIQFPVPTVPTAAGTIELLFIARVTGTVAGVRVAFKDALAAHDTNFVQFSLINKSAADAEIMPLNAANSTKITGGTALSAYTVRSFSLVGGTVAVTSGQLLALRITGAGTLANTLTEGIADVTFDSVE